MTSPRETAVPEQRWVRPYQTEPGFWKRQLPAKARVFAIKGDVPGMEKLLDGHPEALNQRGSHGRTLLWEAARRGHVHAIEWLLEHGAHLNLTGCYNGESVVQLTPYCAAVYYHRSAAAEVLRSAGGAELDVFRAAFMGDSARIEALLTEDPERLDAEDPHDFIYYTPLMAFAVAGGQTAIVEDLEKRGAEVGRYSAQLLRIALTADRKDIARYLLDHGLDARAADSGIFQVTDDLEFLRELIARGVPPTGSSTSDLPPIVFVARGDKGEHPEKVALLLEHGADVNAQGKNGRTALHYVAAVGHRRVAELLLEHGADRAIRDLAGRTAREVALERGRLEVAGML